MTAPAPQSSSRSRRLATTLLRVVLFLLVLAAAAAWLLRTESGLRAAVAIAHAVAGERLAIESAEGRLVGPLKFGVVRFEDADRRLRLDDVRLDWRAAALFERELAIAELAVARVEIASRPGEDEGPPSPPASLALPLGVRVDALHVDRIVVREWTELPVPGEVEPAFLVEDLRARFRSGADGHLIERLTASLPFGQLTVNGELAAAEPFALSASGGLQGARDGQDYSLHFVASGNLLEPLLHIEAEGAGLSGDGDIAATPFDEIPLRSLRLSLGELDPSAFVPDAPQAALQIEADLKARAAEGVGPWGLEGPVSIDNRRPASIDAKGIPVSRASGRLSWTPERAGVDGLVLQLLGKGRVSGSGYWERGRAQAEGQAQDRPDVFGGLVELSGVEMQRMDARLPEAVLNGRISAEGDSARQVASLLLRIGAAELRGELSSLQAETGARRLQARGAAKAVDPQAFIPGAPDAALNFDFRVDASLDEVPRYVVETDIAPSRLRGQPVQGKLRARVEGARLADGTLDLDLAGNRLTANGAWGGERDTLRFELAAPALAALDPRLGGRADLAGTVTGGRQRPAGDFRLGATAVVLPGMRVDALEASGRLGAGPQGELVLDAELRGLRPLNKDAAPGAPREPDWVRQGTLSLTGTRAAHVLQLAVEGLEREGLSLRLEGGMIEPVPAQPAAPVLWSGRLATLELTGRWPAKLQAPATLEAGPRVVALGSANFATGERGRVRLDETRWTGDALVARGSLTGLALGLLTRADGRARRGPGPLVLGGEWDLSLSDVVQGSARVFRESGDLSVTGEIPARLGLEHLEARLGAHAGRLALAIDARGTELGELAGSATAEAERAPEGGWRLVPDAALLGSAHLAMPSIAWVGRLMQEHAVTGGRLDASFALAGTPAEPRASGSIRGRELSLALVDEGLQLSGGDLLAEFDRDRLRLVRLDFVSPNRVQPRDGRLPVARLTATPGRLSASGEIALDSGLGHFNFDADRLPILQRSDRWLILSGVGAANTSWTTLDLAANLFADAGCIEGARTPAPSLSDDVVILGREPKSAGGGMRVAGDVAIALGEHFYLSALGLDTRLTGGLRLRLRGGQPPTAIGTIATAGGTYRGYGQSLSIERGLINFQGPPDNPGLNVVALRKGLAVEAGIEIAGSARRPRIRLVSQPNVPDPEKLSWIVLGRAPSAGGGADMGVLLPAAQALLGGPGGGMTDQLSRSLGFDELSIGQGDLNGVSRTATSRVVGDGTLVTGGDNVGGQVLTLGKRLSSDLFLSFEQSLGGAESLVKLTYQLSRRVSLVARGGSDNAADIYYTISFE